MCDRRYQGVCEGEEQASVVVRSIPDRAVSQPWVQASRQIQTDLLGLQQRQHVQRAPELWDLLLEAVLLLRKALLHEAVLAAGRAWMSKARQRLILRAHAVGADATERAPRRLQTRKHNVCTAREAGNVTHARTSFSFASSVSASKSGPPRNSSTLSCGRVHVVREWMSYAVPGERSHAQ